MRRIFQISALLFVSLNTTGATAAGIADYCSVTINLQGSTLAATAGSKWDTVLDPLAKRYDVVAVQEAGPPHPPPPLTGVTKLGQQICQRENDTVTYDITEYKRPIGSNDGVFVYFADGKMKNERRLTLAIISKQQAKHVVFFCPVVNDNNQKLAKRPIFGIITQDDEVFMTLHAGAHGKNEADSIIRAVDLAYPHDKWAILGDFNRDPGKIKSTNDVRARIVASGQATHDRGKELDYMIVRELGNYQNLKAEILGGTLSDHYQVAIGVKSTNVNNNNGYPNKDGFRCKFPPK